MFWRVKGDNTILSLRLKSLQDLMKRRPNYAHVVPNGATQHPWLVLPSHHSYPIIRPPAEQDIIQHVMQLKCDSL